MKFQVDGWYTSGRTQLRRKSSAVSGKNVLPSKRAPAAASANGRHGGDRGCGGDAEVPRSGDPAVDITSADVDVVSDKNVCDRSVAGLDFGSTGGVYLARAAFPSRISLQTEEDHGSNRGGDCC